MYGDEPDRWSDDLRGTERLRFTINVLTRLRVCTADGRVDLEDEGQTARRRTSPLLPWFEHPDAREPRRARHLRPLVGARARTARTASSGLDTGCVWGGALTASTWMPSAPPVSVPCAGYQLPDDCKARRAALRPVPTTPRSAVLARVDPGGSSRSIGLAPVAVERQHDALRAAHLEHAECARAHPQREPHRPGVCPRRLQDDARPRRSRRCRSTSSVLRFQYCAGGRRSAHVELVIPARGGAGGACCQGQCGDQCGHAGRLAAARRA